jgi:hypothetical protein
MFARRLTMKFKPNMATEFAKTLDTHIIPVLRRQQGFREELVFMGPTANEGFAISLWDGKEYAETYTRSIYPDLLKPLENIVEGIPQVQTFELLSSTMHKSAAPATA